ncbi:hypothetical protein CGZ80_16550 [Rhodopirellula sp. MGV]|nr:hypothetical protein CGZ80_16550 [Rhodopirellula sp. MGV]PNY38349.1 hypothetical protein C2E31_03300 [Rhodopirellula baltica]
MSGTYPITFVAVKLPAFLEKEFARQNALVALVSYPVSVKGFFYRLWSYRNAFMTKEGGGKQVGPLIVAATWNSRLDPSLDEPSGIAWFGYTLAFVILMAVVATVIWQSKNSRQDAAIRKRNRKPVLIDLPSDLSGNFSGMPDVDPESPPSVDRDP